MGSRLTGSPFSQQTPSTSSADVNHPRPGSSHGTQPNGHFTQKVVVNNGVDHDYTSPVYNPAPSNILVRPTNMMGSQNNARSSSLSYATSQRASDVPETMKLPNLRGLPTVSRPASLNDPELAGCARTRVFFSNKHYNKDKFSTDSK